MSRQSKKQRRDARLLLNTTLRAYHHALCYGCMVFYRFSTDPRKVYPDQHSCGRKLYYMKNPDKLEKIFSNRRWHKIFSQPNEEHPEQTTQLATARQNGPRQSANPA